MLKEVKYRCKCCGYSEVPSRLEFFVYFIMVIFAMIGAIAVTILCTCYFILDIDMMNVLASKTSSLTFTEFARENQLELRDIALKITTGCDGDNVYCYSKQIYNNLSNTRYVPTSKYQLIYDPIYTLDKGGDCKNTAMLTTSILWSLGYDAYVDCNVDYNHCMTRVPIKKTYEKEYEMYIIIDLAQYIFTTVNKESDYWEDLYDDSNIYN